AGGPRRSPWLSPLELVLTRARSCLRRAGIRHGGPVATGVRTGGAVRRESHVATIVATSTVDIGPYRNQPLSVCDFQPPADSKRRAWQSCSLAITTAVAACYVLSGTKKARRSEQQLNGRPGPLSAESGSMLPDACIIAV